jgi:hypothetical protein
MEAKLRYSVADMSGKVKSMDDATAVLGQEDLAIRPLSSPPYHFSLRDMSSIDEGEFRISVQLRSGDSLMLFNIGRGFEDFARELFRSANELELRDLLMDEKLLKQGVKCDYALTNAGLKRELGKCEARLYQTAMVIMPEHGGLYRARFVDVVSTEVKDYRLSVLMENGDILEFAKLGRELDPLRKGILENAADLSEQVQRMIKDAYPGADAGGVVAAARLMKEGRPAGKRELEGACPGLWQGLEGKVASSGISQEYAHLAELARKDGVRIGMKRALHAENVEKAEDYVFVLAPIYSDDVSKGGNALAFEASSGEDEGRATYFFRIWSRVDYPKGTLEEMDRGAGDFVTSLASGLNAINFRREPVYLSEEKLFAPEYVRYRYAIIRIPQLRLLREHFIGRVMHTSPEQWKEDVTALLAFNVAQKDDNARWIKVEPVEPK